MFQEPSGVAMVNDDQRYLVLGTYIINLKGTHNYNSISIPFVYSNPYSVHFRQSCFCSLTTL